MFSSLSTTSHVFLHLLLTGSGTLATPAWPATLEPRASESLDGTLFCGNFASGSKGTASGLLTDLDAGANGKISGREFTVGAERCKRVHCWETTGIYVCNVRFTLATYLLLRLPNSTLPASLSSLCSSRSTHPPHFLLTRVFVRYRTSTNPSPCQATTSGTRPTESITYAAGRTTRASRTIQASRGRSSSGARAAGTGTPSWAMLTASTRTT